MGTMPNTTYVHSIAVADLTRVTARVVGVCVGIVFVVLAFLPKLVAVIVAIPGPVAAAYYVALVASLFVLGVRVLVQDGLDQRKGVAVGLAFWLGLAFELDWIFPEYLQGGWGELLANGLTVGGLTVIVLTQFVELTGPRARRLKTELDGDAVELEFAATTDDANLEDQLALLGERAAGPRVEEEVSLRHYASAVRHQQFHDTDVVTVRVGPAAAM